MDRTNFYVGALLHDIGKFAQRTQRFQKKHYDKEVSKYEHAAFSAEFVHDLIEAKHPLGNEEVLNIVLFHHVILLSEKQTMDEKSKFISLVRIADWLSSSERTEDDSVEIDRKFYETPLISVFQRIFKHQEENQADRFDYSFPLKKLILNKENIFPQSISSISKGEYQHLFDTFVDEIKQITNSEQLYHLLEKYTWCIPSATPWGKAPTVPDVSLFDHSRTTAAIALCLYDEYKNSKISDTALFAQKPDQLPDETHFVLAMADFSGVQDFIYSISSKKAARNLKGRSVFLDLLSDVIAEFLIRQLELETANILYNGGGNFFLLLPKCKEQQLDLCCKYVSSLLLNAFQGRLYLALGKTDLSFKDFSNIGVKWREVSLDAGGKKNNRFHELGYHQLFEPFEGRENKVCDVCQSEANSLAPLDDDNGWCPMCESLSELTHSLLSVQFIQFKETEKINIQQWKQLSLPEQATYNDIFKALGFELSINNKNSATCAKKILLNNTEFLDEQADGFKFAVLKLPQTNGRYAIDFDHLVEIAEQDTASKKLALLKMDVDNLGKIFINGLPIKERTISRLATLSRQLRMFFEGFLNTILSQTKFHNKIYTVYAGGDDTFLIGPWHLIFELAGEIRTSFADYTCHNPKVTLSASLTVIDEKFPVIRAAMLAEDGLHKAKNCKENEKNRISIFGEVFTWDEFNYISQIKNILVELIQQQGESRALLQKIMNSSKGFSKLMDKAAQGKIPLEKLWRFAYYIRTIKNKQHADKLVSIYENILLNRLFKGNSIENVMIIPVACRRAELATRKLITLNKQKYGKE